MNKQLLTLVTMLFLITVTMAWQIWEEDYSTSGRIDNIPSAIIYHSNIAFEKDDIAYLSEYAKNLEVPWAMTFLPDERLIITERKGTVTLFERNGSLNKKEIATIEDVNQEGEGGLHGVAAHPDFNENKLIYFYYTYAKGNNTFNRVVRYKLEKETLTGRKVMLDEIPGAKFHNGGRIKFGPDNFLYITTGDAQNPALSQDKNSLAGKILRVTDNGKSAPGNPFNNPVYSYGHRNPQGITWDDRGRLWSTEHGPRAQDELNLIEVGKNYGWPEIKGDETKEGMQTPVVHSGNTTWAPAGAAYLNGSIFFGGLRGQALYEARINEQDVEITTHLKRELGRIRAVITGPDNMLYISTSNKDGRGNPLEQDDRIIRVDPRQLKSAETRAEASN